MLLHLWYTETGMQQWEDDLMKDFLKKAWKEWSVLPFLMAVFALICFLLVFAMMMSMVEPPPVARTMVLLFPALILMGFGVLANLLHFPLGVIWIVTILLTAVLGVWGFRETVFVVVEAFATETTDVRYYGRAYDDIDHEEYLKGIFPEEIPENAENVDFYYCPQFLQGGEVFELSFTTDKESLDAWDEFLREHAEWSGPDIEWCELNNYGRREEGITRYHLYWDGGYNHGEIGYVQIDPSVGRIRFYYSHW